MAKREKKATSGQKKNPARKTARRAKKPAARDLGAPGKSGAGIATNELSGRAKRPSSRAGLPRALFATAMSSLRKGLRRVPKMESFRIMPVGGGDELEQPVKEQSAKKGATKAQAHSNKSSHHRGRS
jgi:hypothetical protein